MITFSTNKSKLDFDFIYQFLIKSYWASDRTKVQMQKSIKNSLCFGMYLDDKQIGFARILTDKVIFSYLMDVFVNEKYQGKKYGEQLMNYIYNYKDLKNVKSHYLLTKDAQTFYTKFGFTEYDKPNRFLIKGKNLE